MKNMAMQQLLQQKNVLLLQGKIGTFFHRFSSFLQQRQVNVHKIHFNGGDAAFYWHKHTTSYRGTLAEFSEWLQAFITLKQIDAVVCFSDCRPYHLKAAKLCRDNQLPFFVFENGYLRPDYITFEAHGVNGFSKLDVSKAEEVSLPLLSAIENTEEEPEVLPVELPISTDNRFHRVVISSMFYYATSQCFKSHYPHYVHHRELGIAKESKAWLTALARKYIGYLPDRKLQQHMVVEYKQQYFLISLQVHNDSQITQHSHYDDVKEFIHQVIVSFAKHANTKHCLLFKHHPLDRGHRHYRKFIKKLARRHQLTKRVFYGCDLHLPTIIKNSIGMVTINSTTGLQSIYHQKPTKAMGKAVYNASKLTDQQPLDKFWQNPQPPNQHFYWKFRHYLIEQNQLNGSFHGRSPWMDEY